MIAGRIRRERTAQRGGALRVARTWLLAGLAAASAACAGRPLPPPALPDALPVYRVGTPDRLEVRILPEPVIERMVVVRPDGRISIDLVGDVQAAGRTVDAIAHDIQKRIARFKRDPRVTVSVAEARGTEVTVLGEVGRPMTVTLGRETRVVEVIGRAGGPTRFASKGRVRVVRSAGGEPQVIPVNLGAIERGDQRTNVLLEGGDIIVVPANVFARAGYAMNRIFFPLQQILGLGGSFVGRVLVP